MSSHVSRRGFLGHGAAALGGAAFGAQWRSRQLRIGWVDDPGRRDEANRAGRNYWNAYVPEILDELGLRATALPVAALDDRRRLETFSTLLVTDLELRTRAVADNLERWVHGGGTLIAFGTRGIDKLCGNRHTGEIAQTGEFTCAARFSLGKHSLTADIHSVLQPDQHLLIFSDTRKIQPERSAEVARLHDERGKDSGCSAITVRELGKGRACYFAFNVPKTIWVLHQGRPVDRDYDDDGSLRRSDAIVIRPHSIEVAYADEILLVLQNMIGTQPHAFIHQLPPVTGAGAIPDALFHWGGDDEGSTDRIQVTASNWMKQQGLPYHINALPRRDGTFGLSIDDARKIQANGHELSLHYNFVEGFAQREGFSREDVLSQAAAFRRTFGQDAVVSVNHVTRWTGWAEPAKWMRDAGGKGDNTFVHAGSPPLNPVNLLGFSFGSAFPFWFYDDWRGGNARIDFLELPITAYECGYLDKERTDFPTIRKAIDTAARYHMTMNLFFHPIYIATYPACRSAIQEALRYIRERKILALHTGNDELYRWWKARSEARVGDVSVNGSSLSLEVESGYPKGVVVKVPLGKAALKSLTINGASARGVKTETRFGQNWVLGAAPPGKARLNLVV